MTHGAEFRRTIEVLHHRALVLVEVCEYVILRDRAANSCSIIFYEHRRNSHDVTACSARALHLLNGVTHGASHALFIEGTFKFRPGGKRAGKQGDGIVAPFAMP